MLDIRIGAKAEFDYPHDAILAQHVNNILKDLAYSNPKYEDAQRLGFSTFGIPREIKTYGVSTTPLAPSSPSLEASCTGSLMHRSL